MVAMTDFFFCIVMYIQVKQIKEKKRGFWFYPLVADWMEVDLQRIVRKGQDLLNFFERRKKPFEILCMHQ